MPTTTSTSSVQQELHSLLDDLRRAINQRNKKKILDLYSRMETIDFDQVDEPTASIYDQLVSECNDILYS